MGMVNDGLGIVKDHGKMFGAIKGTVVQNFTFNPVIGGTDEWHLSLILLYRLFLILLLYCKWHTLHSLHLSRIR